MNQSRQKLTGIEFDEEEIAISNCDLKSNFVFRADNTLRVNDFYDDEQLGCFNDGAPGTYEVSGERITMYFTDSSDEVADTLELFF